MILEPGQISWTYVKGGSTKEKTVVLMTILIQFDDTPSKNVIELTIGFLFLGLMHFDELRDKPSKEMKLLIGI